MTLTIFYDLISANESWEDRSPFDVMRKLGWTWSSYEPQPMADQIKFVDCRPAGTSARGALFLKFKFCD